MKLFVVAALIAVAAAGRLEHLERSYLPPDNNEISGSNSYGSNGGSNGFGSQGSNGFGQNSNGGFGSSNFGKGSNGFGAYGSNSDSGLGRSNGLTNGAFGAATSNQYLPPNHGPSGSSSNGFGNFGSASSRPSSSFGSFGSPSAQYNRQPQYGAASRQYLAPRSSNYQNSPQQSFDEETGYHY